MYLKLPLKQPPARMCLLITAQCNVPYMHKYFQCTSCDNDCSSDPAVDLRSEVLTTLSAAGWNFSPTETVTIFPDQVRIIDNGGYTPAIKHSHVTGRAPSWQLNYPALSFLMNGQYYSEYLGTFSLMGLPVMSDTAWEKVVAWLGKHVETLAKSSCEQVQKRITDRGDKLQWIASYDGFYLTRGHHSNNSSATLHDYATDKIAWFDHRTKRGPGSNWQGTSGGAEGDMLRTILEDVKTQGFKVQQLIMDHDTSGANIACSVFPEVRITYCGNHTAKSFHRDLVKIKSVRCKVNVLAMTTEINCYAVLTTMQVKDQ